jgi:hypothetical protein
MSNPATIVPVQKAWGQSAVRVLVVTGLVAGLVKLFHYWLPVGVV